MDRIKRKRHPYLYVCGIIYIIAIWINLITFNIFNTIETGGIYFEKDVIIYKNNNIHDSISDRVYTLEELNNWLDYVDISNYNKRKMLESKEENEIYSKYRAEYHHDIDSIILYLYSEHKFDNFYKRVLKYRNSPSRLLFKESVDVCDTLPLIRPYLLTLYGLEYSDIKYRFALLNQAMSNLGYDVHIEIPLSFVGPNFNTDYSGNKLFLIWLFAWLCHGLLWNPIMFICLPVGIGFLIFSRNARRQTVMFLRRTFNKLKQWFRLR